MLKAEVDWEEFNQEEDLAMDLLEGFLDQDS